MSTVFSSAPARGRFASFVLNDHRYVLLGTSAVAFIGMMLSSMSRPALSFLAPYYTVELVMYYVLVAWLVLSAIALAFKVMYRERYAAKAPFARAGVKQAVRYGSYIVWAITAVFILDRLVMGIASAWTAALAATARPQDDLLQGMFYIVWHDRYTFLAGLITTIELAVFGTIAAFFLALLLAFCRIQKIDRADNDFMRAVKSVACSFAKGYSTVIRGTPMMIQAMIIYPAIFGLLKGTGMSTTEVNAVWTPFWGGLLTIILNSTAYMMEVLRGGIEAVDPGQMEGARSLGLSQWQAMTRVVFPQGIKHAIPGLSNELVVNIKDSSVLSVIGTFDLMFANTTVTGIYYNQLQPSLISAAIYLCLTMIASWLLGKFARHFDVQPEPLGSTSDQTLVGEE
ncbi:amino acid ABC transporter permease [Collinsella provencensis]|uniref:amino acid ABC transporter permease n=1 Tax=Collinsella provencensis TaxID=1937461 RepID=UPI0018FE524C|nr:amino acid ABC transporter permease [Collinsella provencensis]